LIKWIAPLILLLIVCLSGLLWSRLNQPVTLVRVTGDLNAYERQAIREAVSPSLDQGLLRLQLAAVKADIQALSWPREVTVRRLWPAGLAIDVDKEQALARWGAGGYLSTRGAVISGPANAEPEAQLPIFRCSRAGPREAMEVYRLLSEALVPVGAHITTLSESALGEWEVELSVADGRGLRVVLGRDRLDERMRRFVVVYGRVLRDQLAAVRYADARYANGVAVRWDEPLVAYGAERDYGIGR
jgi:cell division protein FtsQ